MNVRKIVFLSTVFITILVLTGCSSNKENYSRTTGWAYNNKKTTGFSVQSGFKSAIPTGMVAIQGGTFTIGEKGEFVTAPRNNRPRRITVNSFYMDQYEIRNVDWREYTSWMQIVFEKTAPRLVAKAQPDLTVWREKLAYNEPYIENYFNHPAYDQYPVVGVTWSQAIDYCTWRTDRVNELALIKSGAIAAPDFSKLKNMTSADSIASNFVFNTDKYLHQSNYNPQVGKSAKKDLYGQARKVDRADGILQYDYRLPTEAEWEFAAYAIKADKNGTVPEGKIYPWSGSQARNPSKKDLGKMQANFVRGRGDMMGTSGALNDGSTIPCPVDWYTPNDFGLYNMAGNVNEWVLDVYRSTTYAEMAEYNSFRGNIYTKSAIDKLDSIGHPIYKIDSLGRLMKTYTKADDVRNFRDGDPSSQIGYSADSTTNLNRSKTDPTDILRPIISDKTRVYKGGSFKDRIYWINPSTRRYLDQDKCANDIGFRCAMSMTGNAEENGVNNKRKK